MKKKKQLENRYSISNKFILLSIIKATGTTSEREIQRARYFHGLIRLIKINEPNNANNIVAAVQNSKLVLNKLYSFFFINLLVKLVIKKRNYIQKTRKNENAKSCTSVWFKNKC